MSRWQRIEAGYYQLRGTNLAVVNMRGQSVKWTGLIVKPWVVYDGHTEITHEETFADAKRSAERRAAA